MPTDVLAREHSWPPQTEEQRAVAEAAEEERVALQGLVQSLEAQLEVERSRRHEAEQEAEATVVENSLLGQRLAALEGCRTRQVELEAEVEELRQLWRAEVASARRAQQRALPNDEVFPIVEDQPRGKPERGEEVEEELEEEDEEEEEEGKGVVVEEEEEEGWEEKAWARRQSEGCLQDTSGEELRRRHRPTCARRPRALWSRGVSLLSEVDAQYSALQRQYDELLRRCEHSSAANSHKAVQTPSGYSGAGSCPIHAHAAAHAAAHNPRRRLSSSSSSEPPEYKALFMEIFNCIQRTKGDLSDSSVQAIQRIQATRLSQSIQTDEAP